MKRRGKLLIGLLGLTLLPFLPSHNIQAATLTGSPNIDINDLENDFQTIAEAFDYSSDLLLSSVSDTVVPLNNSNQSLQVMLMAEKLSQIEDTNIMGTFAETFNSLKKVEWISVIEKLASAPMMSAGHENSSSYDDNNAENIPDGSKRERSITAQVIDNYLSFFKGGTNSSIDSITLPGFNYNARRPELRLAGVQRSELLELMSADSNGYQRGQKIIEPTVDQGIPLDRPTVTVDKFESALQLWPRNVFATEVKGYGNESGNISETLDNFGAGKVTVNYKTMPKEILKTSLDLEVNWVDRGQYSENLRKTNQAILDIYRERNEKYQQRLEESRQKWVNSQQAYQQRVSARISQSFNSSQKQRALTQNNSNNFGKASPLPRAYR